MKNCLKKILAIMMSIIIIVPFAFQCYAADDNNRELLLSKDFPEDVVNSISDSAVEKIFSSIENYEIADVSAETKYYPENTVENADLAVKTISAQLKDKQSGIYMGETVCVYWEWLDNKPKIREKDYISLKWSDDRLNYESDSFYAEDYSKKNMQDKWIVRNTYNTLAEAKQDSVGHWTDLYEKENCVGGVMILHLIPDSPFVLSASKAFLNCEYTHYIKTLPTTVFYVLIVAFLFVCIFFIIRKKKRQTI
ncbi:MAG: hypothetical protein IJO73_01940 [Clostridia bacterium]|nr:hypothetical protein [Clostridia bacterium]